jgi:hypothetical protein
MIRRLRQSVMLIGFLLVGGLIAYRYFERPKDGEKVSRLSKDDLVILRTPGGMLEVSSLIKNEDFAWSTSHTCWVIRCDKFLRPTVSDVRLPVHYTYRIPLSEKWTLAAKGRYYLLSVPQEQAKLPAAMDFSKMEIKTDKGWFSPSITDNREALLRHLGKDLDRRAVQPAYINAQREQARKTVSDFAQKWMAQQSGGHNLKMPVMVLFPGETVSAQRTD